MAMARGVHGGNVHVQLLAAEPALESLYKYDFHGADGQSSQVAS